MILYVRIITPDKIFLESSLIEEIILPTNTGQLGVLKNHASLITALDIGVLFYRIQKKWISIALMGGFALIQNNFIIILVNEAQNLETVDPIQSKKNFDLAKEKFLAAATPKQKVEANFVYKRARARYPIRK
uniref:ATP synthase epsilon chain, chloroplastic n=1 Tax=Dichotomosiphon tuberosus TaxID=118263 RepID=A0A386AWQ5_9CHLO|nr:ATP synthase CF1 subunit epsilon [Dichotomosiphon tuberosus]